MEFVNPFSGNLEIALLSQEKISSLADELSAHRILKMDPVPIHSFKPKHIDWSAAKVRLLVPEGHQMQATVSFDAQGVYTIHAKAFSQYQPAQEVEIVAQKGTGLININMQHMHNQVIHCVGDHKGMPIYEGSGLLQKPGTKLVVKFGDPFSYAGHYNDPEQSQSHIVQLHKSDYALNQNKELHGIIHDAMRHHTYGFRSESGSRIAVKSVVVNEGNRSSFILITPLSNPDYFFDHLNSDHQTAIIIRKSTGKSTNIHHNRGIFEQFHHVIRDGSDMFLRDEEVPGRGVPLVLVDCLYEMGDQHLSGMYLHDEHLDTHFFEESHRSLAV